MADVVERLNVTHYFSDRVMAVRSLGDELAIDIMRAERKEAASEISRLRDRLATVEDDGWWPIETVLKDGSVIRIRTAEGKTYAAYWGLADIAVSAGADKHYPWVFLDPTNGVNQLADGEAGPTEWRPLTFLEDRASRIDGIGTRKDSLMAAADRLRLDNQQATTSQQLAAGWDARDALLIWRDALEKIAKEVFTDGTPTRAARTARRALTPPATSAPTTRGDGQ